MQPTGTSKLHLGNLEGALRNWVKLQDEYDMFCCVVDWHALTTMVENTSGIADASIEVAIDYMAAGLDPAKTAIFLQSQVKEHAELHLLLSMVTPLGGRSSIFFAKFGSCSNCCLVPTRTMFRPSSDQ